MCNTNRIRVTGKLLVGMGREIIKWHQDASAISFVCVSCYIMHVHGGRTWVVTLKCSFQPSDKTTGICRCFWTVLDPQKLFYGYCGIQKAELELDINGIQMSFFYIDKLVVYVVNYVYSTYFFESCKKVIKNLPFSMIFLVLD